MAVTVTGTRREQYQGLFDIILFKDSAITLTAAAAAETTVDIAVPGAAMGDFVQVGLVEDVEFGSLTAQVTAAGVVTVTLANAGAGTITIAAATLKGMVQKLGPLFNEL